MRYLSLKGLAAKEVHKDMMTTFGDDAVLYSMERKWAVKFKCGREGLEDDPRTGRQTIAIIHDIIMADGE